jgi:HEAT repeat protein
MRTKDGLFRAVLILAAAVAGAPFGREVFAVDKAEIENAVAAVSTCDHGGSRKPLDAVERLARETRGSPELRACLEDELSRLLSSGATPASKKFACQQLWIIGTDRSLPALGKLLLADETVEMACFAISRHPSPAAGRTLREALGKNKGRSLVPVMNLLGERRDAEAVDALVEHAAGQDETVAFAAIAALGKMAAGKAVETLEGLHKSGDAERRSAAAHALLECAQELARKGSVDEARSIHGILLADREHPQIRRAALVGRIELEGVAGASAMLEVLADVTLPAKEKDRLKAALERGVRLQGAVDFDKIEAVPIFDGKTLAGWEGNEAFFRVEGGAIVAGTLKEPIPRNEFLCTRKEYGDFELRLKAKLLGAGDNAGIQIRSRRIPGHHEVSGYQADMGTGWWGCLYDESRRNRVLAKPEAPRIEKTLKPGDWNEYVIRCTGKRIQLWLNGVQTVDYSEPEEGIPTKGIIGLQIHGGAPSEARYKDITIKEAPGPGSGG